MQPGGQLDLFRNADPVDLVLPRRAVISIPELSVATRRRRKVLDGHVLEGRLDAMRFTPGGKFFVPRPAAAAYLRQEGLLPQAA